MISKNLWQYVAVSGLVAASLLFLRWERRIDSCLGDCIQGYHYRVSTKQIQLLVKALGPGDNGRATIAISVNGQHIRDLVGSFNYDTLTDMPVGHAYYWWQDADFYPDLHITLTDPSQSMSYYISSHDGALHRLN